MKNLKKLSVLAISLILVGCNSPIDDKGEKLPETNILVIFDGYEGDIVNDQYRRAIEANKDNELNVKFTTYDLGTVPEMYNSDVQAQLGEKEYDATLIFGERAKIELEPTIKVYQGYKFITIDAFQQKIFDNEASYDFSPEEFGYMAGQISTEKSVNKKISYFTTYQGSFNNRKLYGFMQGAKKQNSDVKILPNYVESEDCLPKIEDYVKQANQSYNVDTFYASLNEVNSNYIVEKNGDSQLILDYDSEFTEDKVDTYINKDYTKTVGSIISSVVDKSIQYKTRYELGIDGDYIKVNKDYKFESIKKLTEENKTDFNSLSSTLLIDNSKSYTPKYTSYAQYNEADPLCSELNDWKHAPRIGADNGAKPVDWKAMGIWSTIYPQDGKPLSENTGIEFKNMKTYGYSKRRGWQLIEHANPVGAFYDKDFINDAHIDIPGNVFNFKDEKRTKILLDSKTKGYNYHPFGQQNDLQAIDMVDVEYVISAMDIRLIVWNNEKSIDIDDAKYVANIGGDWWSYKGATWQPDWSANRDISVAQFRIITKEWKTLYMSSIPVEKYDSIVGDASFLND